jgi:hypothetical protein
VLNGQIEGFSQQAFGKSAKLNLLKFLSFNFKLWEGKV